MNDQRVLSFLTTALLAACVASPRAPADEDDLSLMPGPLTGDWWGARSYLEDRGISFGFDYTADVFSNVSGGIRRRTVYMGNVDLTLEAQLEKLVGWKGARIFLYGLGLHGDSITENVGDAQFVSNIDVLGLDTWKLFEGWVEQELFDSTLSVLVGLYDLNSEIDAIPTAELFLNSSFGIGADYASSGVNGPSIFPTTSLGARIAVHPVEDVYLRAVVMDGVPGNPEDPFGTHAILGGRDGVLLASEIGYINNPELDVGFHGTTPHVEGPAPGAADHLRRGHFGKYGVGVWGYTTEFEDFFRVDANGNPALRRGSYGVYALAEQRVYHEELDPTQGLSLFVRAGLADERVNPIGIYLGGGAVYRGLIPGRHLDRVGFGVAAARFGSEFQESLRLAGENRKDWEVALELTYRARLASWLTLQPNFQYVINPGGDADLDDAVVLAVRMVVSF